LLQHDGKQQTEASLPRGSHNQYKVFQAHSGGGFFFHFFFSIGAYGMVASALDAATNERVAIKRVTPFEHHTFVQRTLREIKILNHFKHENIVRMLYALFALPTCPLFVVAVVQVFALTFLSHAASTVLTSNTVDSMRDVYLVLELMETDLQKVLKSLRKTGVCGGFGLSCVRETSTRALACTPSVCCVHLVFAPLQPR
jgi:serine/threonine protein kinase